MSSHWKTEALCTIFSTSEAYVLVVISNGIEGEHRTRKWQSGGGILRALTRLTCHNNHI